MYFVFEGFDGCFGPKNAFSEISDETQTSIHIRDVLGVFKSEDQTEVWSCVGWSKI